MRSDFLFVTLIAIALGACSEASKRPVGSTCAESEECASGLCFEQTCIEPALDDDSDGLTNGVEVELESDPRNADSDGDGVSDGDEVEGSLKAIDTDGDGRANLLESAIADADSDCVSDESDPHDDDAAEGRNASLVALHCPDSGVCAGATTMRVACPTDLDTPECVLEDVPGYAPADVTCDRVDDDCDGELDEEGDCGALPQGCWAISPRVDGRYRIDFDGVGLQGPMEVACLFSVEFGDWMRYEPEVAAAAETLAATEPREYLFRKGGAWYRSPITTARWSWQSGAVAPGLWIHVASDGAMGGIDCAGTAPGKGVGCVNPDGRRVEVTAGDAATGTVTVCDSAGGAFGSACESGVELYVRFRGCRPDEGQLLADGGFSGFKAGQPCWYAVTAGVPLANFKFDDVDIPPGGKAPSLRGDNPRLGNNLWEIEVGQSRFPILAGRAYTLGFWARAAEPRTIRPFMQSLDLSVYVHHADVNLGTAWERHELNFRAPGSTWNGMLTFQLGSVSTAAVWLDDVTLIDHGMAAPSPCDPVPGRIVADGSFDVADHACWKLTTISGVTGALESDLSTFPESDSAPSLKVTQSPGNDIPSNVILSQEGLDIPRSRHLRFSFWLRADAPVWMGYRITGGNFPSGYTTPLSPAWKQYAFEFDSSLGASDASLQFEFGNSSAAPVWIDDIRIDDLGPGTGLP